MDESKYHLDDSEFLGLSVIEHFTNPALHREDVYSCWGTFTPKNLSRRYAPYYLIAAAIEGQLTLGGITARVLESIETLGLIENDPDAPNGACVAGQFRIGNRVIAINPPFAVDTRFADLSISVDGKRPFKIFERFDAGQLPKFSRCYRLTKEGLLALRAWRETIHKEPPAEIWSHPVSKAGLARILYGKGRARDAEPFLKQWQSRRHSDKKIRVRLDNMDALTRQSLKKLWPE